MKSKRLSFVRSLVGVAIAPVSIVALLGHFTSLDAQERPGATNTILAQAPAPAAPAPVPPPNPDRNAYFGETHVHTSWSLDAFSIGNTVTDPGDAYKYFKGEPIKHPLGFEVKIDTPLDWAGVTDHSEYAGVVQLANTPGSPISQIPEAKPLILKAKDQAEMMRVALYAINVLVAGPPVKVAPVGNGRPLLLLSDDAWPMWISVGTIGAEHAPWLRVIAAGKRSSAMNAAEWRDRVALMLPYLENAELFVAEIAYGELAAAPYAALLTVKSRIAAPAVRRWLGNPELASRQSLYLLLLGIAGDAMDAARLESQLDAAWQAADATNVGSLIAADLQLRGPARVSWVDEHYLRDRKRATPVTNRSSISC